MYMKNSIKLLKVDLCKKWMFYFILFFGSFFIFSFSFISCAPPDGARLGSGNGDVPDEHDKEQGCRGYEQCEDICEDIYDESWEACSKESSETVTSLQKVFNRLKSTRADRSEFDEISEEEGGITLDDFRKYLELGADGWLEQIEDADNGSSDGYEPSVAQDAIHWLAEEEDVAEILADMAEDGSEILEALLDKANRDMSGNRVPCFWSGATNKAKITNESEFQFSTSTIQIFVVNSSNAVDTNPTVTVKIDNDRDADLYDLLSCQDVGGNSAGKDDIFSLAADENNEYLFNLAFDLLDEVCRDSNLKSLQSEREAICRRAMMCVVAIQYSNSAAPWIADRGDIESWDGWDYAEDRFNINGFDEDEACDINTGSEEFGGNIDINI